MTEFPKYSADLLAQLADEIPRPEWPKTATGAGMLDDKVVRQYIWFAAQRALVDSLLAQVEELDQQEEEANEQSDFESYWSSAGGPRVLPANCDLRTASIGTASELEPDAAGEVSNHGDT